MLSLSPWSIKLLRFENWNFPRVKKIAKCKHHLLHVSFFLILTRALEHVFCLGESRLSQVNNSPRPNAQALFSWPRVDLARLLRRAYSRPFWITSGFEFVKVYGIRFSIWESFIGFYICCYPITTILACLFSVGVRISWKKLCWMRACRRKWHLVFPTLYIIIVYRVNLNKLSRNFVGAIRTTTTNCRVSFIDLYLVFPINFRMVFLPHTNTVILLEPYCGTITDPGLPVVLQHLFVTGFVKNSHTTVFDISRITFTVLTLRYCQRGSP